MIIHTTALRSATVQYRRERFYVFIDEEHSFISASFANMLSQVRKFGVGLFLTY